MARTNKRQWLAAIRADEKIHGIATVLAVAADILAHPDAAEPDHYLCNQRAVAQRLRVTRVTVTRAVGALVDRGYIERLSRGGSTAASRFRVLPARPPNTEPVPTHWYKIYTNTGINE